MNLIIIILIHSISNEISGLRIKDKSNNATDFPNPIILVPGLGGSRAYATEKVYFYKVTKFVWVNFQYMLSPGDLTKVFKLVYDTESHTTTDMPNVKVEFPGWGSTEMIENVGEWNHKITSVFETMVNELVKDKYYVRNKTLRGAPYDFRKAPRDSLGSPRNPIHFREVQRSFPSTSFLLPNPEVFGDLPIIITPGRNYSAKDYDQLFTDIFFPIGSMMYNDTMNLVDGSKTPEGIDQLICIHGHGLETIEQLIFDNFPSITYKPVKGDGDSTVNLRSLELCKQWKDVDYETIENGDHVLILGNAQLIEKVKETIYR